MMSALGAENSSDELYYADNSSDTGSNISSRIVSSMGQRDLIESIFLLSIESLIFVIGAVGNALLIYTTLANVSMRTISNVLLVNMSVGNLVVLVHYIPLMFTNHVSPNWILGEGMCKMISLIPTLSVAVTIFSMVAMSVERYLAVVHPITARKWLTRRRTVSTTVGVWIMAAIMATPEVVHPRVVIAGSTRIKVCNLFPMEGLFERWYYVSFRPTFHFVVLFLVPVFWIVVMNVIVARQLLRKHHFQVQAGFSSGSGKPISLTKSDAVRDRSRRRAARIVVLIVSMFILCWLPWNVFTLAKQNGSFRHLTRHSKVTWKIVMTVLRCLTLAHSCLNPIILYFASNDFCVYFNHYLTVCCYRSRKPERYLTKNKVRRNGLDPRDQSTISFRTRDSLFQQCKSKLHS